MPVWILDSVALIDWYCGRRGVAPYLARIISGEERGGFSTMSEVELWQGLRPGEEERHEAIFSLLERIPVDGAIARHAGQLRRQFGLERLSLPDAVIAASAALTGYRLLTRNTHDFEALRSLIVVEFYSNR